MAAQIISQVTYRLSHRSIRPRVPRRIQWMFLLGEPLGRSTPNWENPMKSAARFGNVIRWIVALLVRIMMLWKYPPGRFRPSCSSRVSAVMFDMFGIPNCDGGFHVSCCLHMCLLVATFLFACVAQLPFDWIITFIVACSVDHSIIVDAIIQFCPDAG